MKGTARHATSKRPRTEPSSSAQEKNKEKSTETEPHSGEEQAPQEELNEEQLLQAQHQQYKRTSSSKPPATVQDDDPWASAKIDEFEQVRELTEQIERRQSLAQKAAPLLSAIRSANNAALLTTASEPQIRHVIITKGAKVQDWQRLRDEAGNHGEIDEDSSFFDEDYAILAFKDHVQASKCRQAVATAFQHLHIVNITVMFDTDCTPDATHTAYSHIPDTTPATIKAALPFTPKRISVNKNNVIISCFKDNHLRRILNDGTITINNIHYPVRESHIGKNDQGFTLFLGGISTKAKTRTIEAALTAADIKYTQVSPSETRQQTDSKAAPS